MLENVKNILGKYLETNYKDSNIQLNEFSFNESMDPNLEEVEAVEWFDLEKTYEECKYCRDTFCVPSGGFEVVRKYLRENQ